MRVEELINSWGPPPTAPESIRSEDTYHEVVKVYHEMYAPGLHSFFESNWFYFSENGKMSFPRYEKLVGHMAVFLKVLEGVKVNDHAQMTYSGALELRLVWELARMAASAAPDNADNRMRGTLPPENDPVEVKHRFRVVEALLGGETVPWNPLGPPVQDANPHRTREFDFWYQLGEFVRRPAGGQGGAVGQDDKAGEDALSRLRWLLDGRENRDVLYSIAVLRHYAHRFDMSQALQAKYHLPEEDPRNKVVVASKFISAQAHVTGGTTNVVRRICDIASRLYVNPGDNVRGVTR